MNPLREALLKTELETREIDALGTKVICRELRPREVTEFFERNKESPAKAAIYLAIIGATDTAGEPIFTVADEALFEESSLAEKSFKRKNKLVTAVNLIVETIMELTEIAGTPAEKKDGEPPAENDSPATIAS